MNSRLAAPILLAITLTLVGCPGMPSTQSPLPGIKTANVDARNSTLVVMLPGRGDRADVFIREGFQRTGERLGFDTIAVDAHVGYYMERSLIEKLHQDIVIPARAAGYDEVWLLGISMGGLGSLLYAAAHPDQVDGVILLAPFLGDRSAIKEIVESGPLDQWTGEESKLEDYEIAIWSWIRDASSEPGKTPLILGYGLSDRMAEGYERLIDVMKPAGVYTSEGGHKWTTWAPLWDKIASDLKL